MRFLACGWGRRASLSLAGVVVPLLGVPVRAEPAIAVRTGFACSQCHVNRTGGGMRTAFGSVYTQTILPAHLLTFDGGGRFLPADPEALVGFGGDARFRYARSIADQADDVSSFDLSEANLFLQGRLIPGRLIAYLDEIVGPAGASAREVFGLLGFPRARAWIKLGRFLPAYGWRLPDDDTFIRQSTGFTYSAPDTGVEFGIEPGRFGAVLSVMNGAGGGSDDDLRKKVNLRLERRFEKWRLGLSAADNDAGGVGTTWSGVFAGGNWGRLALLVEGDRVVARESGARTERLAGYIEADLLVSRGLNLKYVHDWLDPDTDVGTDERTRDSLGIEYVPIPFVQVRLFVRGRDGPPQIPGSRDDQVEIEIHLFF